MRQPLAPHAQSAPATALTLPERPNLDQLRHRARDLLRRAKAGDSPSVQRLSTLGKGATLAAAQLVIAREHGFPSWERLKEEVERRRTALPGSAAPATPTAPVSPVAPTAPVAPTVPPTPRYAVRRVGSIEELGRVCDVIGAQIAPPLQREDRRFQELWPRFEADRSLMWLAEDQGEIVGGALGFRPGGAAITVRAIGLAPRARRQGLGRRLMAAIELEAMKLGARGISLGTSAESKGFYQRLGYAGRGSMMQKGLPLPGRLLEARLRKLAAGAAAE